LVESLKTQRIERVSCGKDFTVAVTRQLEKSSVYSWGNNEFGQLALEGKGNVILPTRVTTFDVLEECEVIEVSCGGFHSLFLTDACDVISSGSNQFG